MASGKFINFQCFYWFERLCQGVPTARLYSPPIAAAAFSSRYCRHLRHAPGSAARGRPTIGGRRAATRGRPWLLCRSTAEAKSLDKLPGAGGWRTKWGSGWTEYFCVEWPTKARNGATRATGVSAANEGVRSGVQCLRRENGAQRYKGTRELPERRRPERKNYDRPALAAVGDACLARLPCKSCIGLAKLLPTGAGARPLFPQSQME